MSAHKALSSALTGVALAADEEEQLVGRLKAAADKKVADLLQVCTQGGKCFGRQLPCGRLARKSLQLACVLVMVKSGVRRVCVVSFCVLRHCLLVTGKQQSVGQQPCVLPCCLHRKLHSHV